MSEKKKKDPFYDLIMHNDLAQNRWPSIIEQHKKSEKHISLMAQVMTKEIFDEYRNHKTAKAGWSIARAINTGVCYPNSFVGCHAADRESYYDFAKLFHPVVEKYHAGFSMKKNKHITDLDVDKIGCDLTKKAKSKIISTRIRVARNLSFFPLNPGGTQGTRLQIMDLMERVFGTLEDELQGNLFRHSTMSKRKTQELIDQHFLFRGRDKMQAASGYHQFWPAGRGIFITKAEDFLLWLNEGDHLRIISMEAGGDVRRVFKRLGLGIAAIEESLKKLAKRENVFMSDETLGMITCCPSNLGTAMRGSVHILVPKLISKMGLDGIDKIARQMNCQARGSSGEHSKVVDRVDISNWRRLGFCEYVLVEDMIKCVNKLSDMEDSI